MDIVKGPDHWGESWVDEVFKKCQNESIDKFKVFRMIIVNQNGARLSKALADPGTGSDANAPNGPAFEQALQEITASVTDPALLSPAQQMDINAQQVNASAPTNGAHWQGDWQHTLAQEKVIQDQLSLASKPDFVVTNPGGVSLGNNDPVLPASVVNGPAKAHPASDLDPVLKNIIAWRQEQVDPLMQVRVGDTWANQGIEDPFNEPHLISQAQEILEAAQRRFAMNPGTKAPWDGDWQSALTKERATEAQRIALLADGAAKSNFVAGGKG